MDLEQLRLSISKEDIPSAIGQVGHWIDTHGLTLLRNHQRLPFNLTEAEEIRKEHEKVELKCMTVLAMYAKMNLRNISQQDQSKRIDMDLIIHMFSDHIKARRHLVVSYFTLFRHLQKLKDQLAAVQTEDITNLPNSVEEMHIVIGKFNRTINNCLKRLENLKEEADRVRSSMETIMSLNDSTSFDYVDRERLDNAKLYIDKLLTEMDVDVISIFETKRLVVLELKIEAKMLVIEEDIDRCCGWLKKMEMKLIELYCGKGIGIATVENDVLYGLVEELVRKMKLTKEYAGKLMRMNEKLCLLFKRNPTRGRIIADEFKKLWRHTKLVSTELLSRLSKAKQLFHGLDCTLDDIENILLSIHKDIKNNVSDDEIAEKYRRISGKVLEELRNMKQAAQELFVKLKFNLANEKLKSTKGGYVVAEQTEDMVKMKIFTIAVKLKELDRYISKEDIAEISDEKVSKTKVEPVYKNMPDENIAKYITFLNTTSRNWQVIPLPVNIRQAIKALEEHQGLANYSEQTWQNIESVLTTNGPQCDEWLLSDAGREKKIWDNKWRWFLNEQLEPRYLFFKKVQDFNKDLAVNQDVVSDLVNLPNNNLSTVQQVKKDLAVMKSQIKIKEQSLATLHKEAINIHDSDLNKELSIVDSKLESLRDSVVIFFKLESMIEELLEFLPQLSQFKKERRIKGRKYKSHFDKMSNSNHVMEKIQSRIARFDLDKLRRLANETYGNNKRVEWLIDELRMDFIEPRMSLTNEEYISPEFKTRSQLKPKRNDSISSGLSSQNELEFEINTLPQVDKDQYNLHWYKDSVAIDPSTNMRIRSKYEPQKEILNTRMEKSDQVNAGKNWCETFNPSKETRIDVGDAPKLLNRYLDKHVKLGEAITITIPTVKTGNKNKNKVVWRKDGEILPRNGKEISWLVNNEGDPILEVLRMRASDTGLYSCELSNEYGRTEAEVILSLLDNAAQRHPKTIIEEDGSTIDNLSVNIGESLILVINYAPAKNMKVDWIKDDIVLNEGDSRIKIWNDTCFQCTLKIDETKVTDSGLYTAIVRGTTRRQSTIIKIMPRTLAPVIERYPHLIRINENEPLNIDCLIRNMSPSSKVTWTLHPIDVNVPRSLCNDGRCTLTSTTQGDVTKVHLCVMRVDGEDAGGYVIHCRNNVGSSSVKIPVTVITTNNSRCKKNPPLLLQCLKKDVTGRTDEPLLLRCKVIGNPIPIVKWVKDGRDTALSDHIKIENIGETYELSITNLRSSDSGIYEVIATNPLGSVKSQCIVSIHASRHTPVPDSTMTKYVTTNKVYGEEPNNGKQSPLRTQLIFSNTVLRSPPKFMTTFTDEIVKEGKDIILRCRLTGQPEPVVWWSYNTHLLKNHRFKMSQQFDEYCLTMHNVKVEETGRYSITAENSIGLATCSAMVIVDDGHGSRSVDKSQYKINSKSKERRDMPHHSTLSQAMRPASATDSRIMQASPRGWDDNRSKSSLSESVNYSEPRPMEENDEESAGNIDFSKSKTKIVKTYHYSGPSGIDLPGIGFIPKIKRSSLTSSCSSSSDEHINRAVFVPGSHQQTSNDTSLPSQPHHHHHQINDMTRFSVVESSDCDNNY